MLEHESTIALSHYHEVRVNLPKSLAELDEEWVGIGFHVVGVPIAIVLISNYDFTVQEIFR